MRAHAISHTNPFIAHLAYVGFTYQFCTPPRPCPAAFFRLTPLAVAVAPSQSRLDQCPAVPGPLLFVPLPAGQVPPTLLAT